MTHEIPVLVVDTAHSRYVIDQNKGEYVRTRVHKDAADLTAYNVIDGGWRPYRDVLSNMELGTSVVITHHDDTWLHSTAIQSVREVPAREFYAGAAAHAGADAA